MKRTNKTKTPTATHHNGTPPTAAPAAPASPPKPKLELTRVFSSPDRHPFEEIEWEQREVAITNDKGKAIFQQKNVEIPKNWSELAAKIVVSKYFYGDTAKPEREYSVKQLVHRVTRTIADWAVADGYLTQANADVFYAELTWLCIHQHAAFNSPVWFNVGLFHQYQIGNNSAEGNWFYNPKSQQVEVAATQYEYPQGSACFIQQVEDNMQSILNLVYSEGMLFKFGSGTGTDLSPLRASRERLSGGGKPSGPLSFLRVYDQVANVVKSGGKTRRAAKMNTLRDWHGDIEEFIEAKANEEKKAWALIAAGYDASFNGDAYGSVMFQNENLSVRVSDDFMRASLGEHDGDWWTRSVTTGRPLEKKDARLLMDKIAQGTWICGDPGLQYDDTIQKWHTCKGTEPIHSTNPCSEYVFLNNTACNLSSLNLMRFKKADGTFDIERFRAAIRIMILAQEIIVGRASYPTKLIAENSHIFRTLGLGYANLGSLIMSYGLPYDSNEARALTGAITATMTGEAYAMSATIAQHLEPFQGYRDARCGHVPNPLKKDNVESMLDVIAMHRAAVETIHPQPQFDYIKNAARTCWANAEELGRKHGYRNAQVTVLAPTGTISFMMDCDTTGIEPDIALVKYKVLAGGGALKIVNQTVRQGLHYLGYAAASIDQICHHIETYDTIEDVTLTDQDKIVTEGKATAGETAASGLQPAHLAVFDCAFKAARGQRSIPSMAHLRIMSAAQPFISGAISKTVNVPNDATAQDIRQIYIDAWKMGLKCVAVYRDGSKRSQPLNVTKTKDDELKTLQQELDAAKAKIEVLSEKVGKPVRRRLEKTRPSITHKFAVGGHDGYFTVGMYPNGNPGELFIEMAKQGSTVAGLMDGIATLTSISMQYGVPLEVLVSKFAHTSFDPRGFTGDPEISQATSILDYIFRWLELKYAKRISEQTVQPELKFDTTGIKDAAQKAITAANVLAGEFDVEKQQAIDHPQSNHDHPPGTEVTTRFGNACGNCGSTKIRMAGSCGVCSACGSSQGCS